MQSRVPDRRKSRPVSNAVLSSLPVSWHRRVDDTPRGGWLYGSTSASLDGVRQHWKQGQELRVDGLPSKDDADSISLSASCFVCATHRRVEELSVGGGFQFDRYSRALDCQYRRYWTSCFVYAQHWTVEELSVRSEDCFGSIYRRALEIAFTPCSWIVRYCIVLWFLGGPIYISPKSERFALTTARSSATNCVLLPPIYWGRQSGSLDRYLLPFRPFADCEVRNSRWLDIVDEYWDWFCVSARILVNQELPFLFLFTDISDQVFRTVFLKNHSRYSGFLLDF